MDNANNGTGGADLWPDYPASNHGGSGALAFADGHSEIRKWLEPFSPSVPSGVANIPVKKSKISNLQSAAPSHADLIWLQQRTTSLQ
jgi:prepilin-type processing-associated H-X9-DG protein